MFAYILIGLAIIVVAFVVVVLMQPGEFRIVRATTMAARMPAIFEQVNDFHNWPAWSPWEKIDPELKRAYEGPPVGIGSGYSWAGNSKVGQGRMTITESQPPEMIRIKLEFLTWAPPTTRRR